MVCRAESVADQNLCLLHVDRSTIGSAYDGRTVLQAYGMRETPNEFASLFRELSALELPATWDFGSAEVTGSIELEGFAPSALAMEDLKVDGNLAIRRVTAGSLSLRGARLDGRLELLFVSAGALNTTELTATGLFGMNVYADALYLDDARIGGPCSLRGSECVFLSLDRAVIRGACDVSNAGNCSLADLTAEGPVRVEWQPTDPKGEHAFAMPPAPVLDLTSANLSRGIDARWGPGRILLSRARFGGVTTLDAAPGCPEHKRPSIPSFYEVDTADVALRNVELRTCMFGGAHNLRKISEFDPTSLELRLGRRVTAAMGFSPRAAIGFPRWRP